MEVQHERLRFFWDHFQSSAMQAYKAYRHKVHYHDVLLAVDAPDTSQADSVKCQPAGGDDSSATSADSSVILIPSHRLVLASSSQFFDNLFQQKYLSVQPKPVVYLKGVSFKNMTYILDFVYTGEVHLISTDLDSFMQDANSLKVNGICDSLVGTSSTLRDISMLGLSLGMDETTLLAIREEEERRRCAAAASAMLSAPHLIDTQSANTTHLSINNMTLPDHLTGIASNNLCSTPLASKRQRIRAEHGDVNNATLIASNNNIVGSKRTPNNDPSLYCTICERYYKNMNSYRTHVYQTHKKPPTLGMEGVLGNAVEEVEGSETGGMLCNLCNKAYKNVKSLRTHIYAKHGGLRNVSLNLADQSQSQQQQSRQNQTASSVIQSDGQTLGQQSGSIGLDSSGIDTLAVSQDDGVIEHAFGNVSTSTFINSIAICRTMPNSSDGPEVSAVGNSEPHDVQQPRDSDNIQTVADGVSAQPGDDGVGPGPSMRPDLPIMSPTEDGHDTPPTDGDITSTTTTTSGSGGVPVSTTSTSQSAPVNMAGIGYGGNLFINSQ